MQQVKENLVKQKMLVDQLRFKGKPGIGGEHEKIMNYKMIPILFAKWQDGEPQSSVEEAWECFEQYQMSIHDGLIENQVLCKRRRKSILKKPCLMNEMIRLSWALGALGPVAEDFKSALKATFTPTYFSTMVGELKKISAKVFDGNVYVADSWQQDCFEDRKETFKVLEDMALQLQKKPPGSDSATDLFMWVDNHVKGMIPGQISKPLEYGMMYG